MTINDFFAGVLCVVGVLACPAIMMVMCNWGSIKFYFRNEKIEMSELENYSIEVRRHALYLQKLEKVYALVNELNLDEGFYGDFKRKLTDEIRYITGRFEAAYGKEILEKTKRRPIEKKEGE